MTIEEQERAAIMEFDGGLGRLDAERLARERPWDTDPTWGMPKPVQVDLFTDPENGPKGETEPGSREPDYIRRLKEKYC